MADAYTQTQMEVEGDGNSQSILLMISHVGHMEGGTTTIKAKPSALMSKVKQMLAKHSKVPITSVRLRFKGSDVKDDDTVQKLGMKNNDEMEAIIQLSTELDSVGALLNQ